MQATLMRATLHPAFQFRRCQMLRCRNNSTGASSDLPGIGDSLVVWAIRIQSLAPGFEKAQVVGNDIGLMVAYAYAARSIPEADRETYTAAYARPGRMHAG
jgi:hypothetical protein